MNLYVSVPATLALAYLIYRLVRGGSRAKPDPRAPPCLPYIPVIGSLFFIAGTDRMHLECMEKAKQLGKVFAFYSGSQYWIVLNGYKAIREALVERSYDFAGRRPFYSDDVLLNVERRGFISKDYGDGYKENHKHTTALLSQYGFDDKRTLTLTIHAELSHLLDRIKALAQASVYPQHLFQHTTLNIMYNLLFGERFEVDDSTARFLTNAAFVVSRSFDPLLGIFPMLAYLPKNVAMMREAETVGLKFNEYCRDKIRECLERAKKNGEKNFVTDYVARVGENYNERELVYIIRDFLMPGSASVTTHLAWFLIFIGNRPDIQRRLQAEIDAVVPKDHFPSMDDLEKMPYVEATMLELMRVRPISPFSIPHSTLCHTEVDGYAIPANTMVLINLYSGPMDPDVFPDPMEFRPERYLDEEGKVINRDTLIGFGLGRRACPGKLLARHELFSIWATLLQHFDTLPPEGETTIRSEMVVGQQLQAAPFNVRFVPRA